MALSNILNEPRREITETGIGLAIVAFPLISFAALDYWLALTIAALSNPPMPLLVAIFVSGLVLTALGMLIVGGIVGMAKTAHAIGERVCDVLDERGVHLRPRRERRESYWTDSLYVDRDRSLDAARRGYGSGSMFRREIGNGSIQHIKRAAAGDH